ncbi:glucokinase [Chitinophaga sp. CB10]|uniref:glucokinase n=1 Tax=Chitinophaga sp. CB10 TaxID=1891659 RepID=UPI000AB0C705|nr:glucokinase [Chitinophaga sp. CB10]
MTQQLKKQQYLPAFPEADHTTEKIYLLAGDLGGTKTNLALYSAIDGELDIVREKTYVSRDYENITDMFVNFLAESRDTPVERICIGVAGPVFNGTVQLTNLSRELTTGEIRQATGVELVALINDLEATAYGLATLSPEHITTLHRGEGSRKGNMAIIAPGTGLGMAGLYWDGQHHHPFASEGGHSDFAARNDVDIKLLKYLQEKYEIASWERVISGPGIYDIYVFLRDVMGYEESSSLREAILKGDKSAVISKSALMADASITKKTMELFVRYLARVSADLALKYKSTGGIFLGGGIPPKIAPLLETGEFYNHYIQGDRMAELLSGVPIHIVNNDKAALWGAAYYAQLLK